VDFGELWRYRELLFFLVWRDIKIRYKQTVLGGTWAVLEPIVGMVIFSIIFGKFAKLPSEGIPYPVFVYAGLLPWTFFSNGVSQGGMSLINQSHLFTKVYFPRLFIPATSVGAGLVDLGINFVVYFWIMVWYGRLPDWSVIFLPGLVLLTVMATLGAGYILAGLTVVYRDLRFTIPFMLQVIMYASPVVYPVSLLPEQYRWIMAMNPMTGIIGGYRSVLLGQPMNWEALGISVLVSAGLLVFGMYNFRRTERRFADIA